MASPLEQPGEASGETWTADRLTQLEQLWKAGETAQAIADRLGVSRSAVMGKLFRLQLGRRKRRSKVSESRGKKPGESRGDESGKKRGKSLLELKDGDCRWPIGDPGSEKFHFCGEPGADIEQDVPYCPLHMKRAYVAPPPRKAGGQTGGSGGAGGWHTISSGIAATVRRMFRDAIARKERT